jgi:hypothetical protein
MHRLSKQTKVGGHINAPHSQSFFDTTLQQLQGNKTGPIE